MISHDTTLGRFNLRAAGIAMKDGHVLVTRETTDAVWYLPGGRVEWGESTQAAVAREIEEELGVTCQIGELAIVLENFFSHAGKRWHELAYYFPVTLPDDFPFRVDGEVCHRSRDGSVELEFKWITTQAEVLREQNFRPEALVPELSATHNGVRHVVWIEEANERETAIG
jgi:ADP-ribose pyrophosphatase YjhB (NUDIX family)